MNSLNIELKEIASKTALDEGFEVIAIDLHTHLNPMTIKLDIRPKGGGYVSLDDCARLSPFIGSAFDNSNLIKNGYLLEISSPGLSEFLETDKDFDTFKGFPVEVQFTSKNKCENKQKGLLHERTKEELKLNCKGRIIIMPTTSVINVRLVNSEE